MTNDRTNPLIGLLILAGLLRRPDAEPAASEGSSMPDPPNGGFNGPYQQDAEMYLDGFLCCEEVAMIVQPSQRYREANEAAGFQAFDIKVERSGRKVLLTRMDNGYSVRVSDRLLASYFTSTPRLCSTYPAAHRALTKRETDELQAEFYRRLTDPSRRSPDEIAAFDAVMAFANPSATGPAEA